MRSVIAVSMTVWMLCAVSGCKSVTSDQLIGVPIDAEEAAGLEGVWDLNDGVVHVKHLDGANLVAARLDWDNDQGAFKLNQLHVVVTRPADPDAQRRYVQVVAKDEQDGQLDLDDAGNADTQKTPWLLMGLMRASGDDALVLYGPRFEAFESAVGSGALAGTVDEDGNTVRVTADKAAWDAFIADHEAAELFRMDDPGVITRVGDVD